MYGMNISFPIPDVAAPYPGLRPFRQDESAIFFGRDQQIGDILARLKNHQFLGVVGSSGCGKSSLVRAGMLPALISGEMGEVGSTWFVADMKPGDSPVTNLAEALIKSHVLGDRWSYTPEGVALLAAALRRSDVSLINLIRQVELPKYANLLVLADQFEEIFRFQQHDPNEALAIVDLLLTTGRDRSVPIYVVLTMRTDYLGNCALFPGLPEALNDSQYLCPRLTRDELNEAIEGPAVVFGAEIQKSLITQIVNDAGANSDQLPLVQHVLSRMWHNIAGDTIGTGHENSNRILRLTDYLNVGGLNGGRGTDTTPSPNALSQHADEAYFSLHDYSSASQDRSPSHKPSRKQMIAQMLFRCLAERGPSGQYVRRPMKVRDVAAVAGCSDAEVIAVVEVFRSENRCFLVPPVGTMLTGDSVLDISHEALIRQWRRLAGTSDQIGEQESWLAMEEECRHHYRRLADAADSEATAGLLKDPELSFLDNWWQEFDPKEAWANSCVHDSFQRTEKFLAKSRQAASDERQQRETDAKNLEDQVRRKRVYRAALVPLLIVTATIWWLERGRSTALVGKSKALAERIWRDAREKLEGNDLAASLLWIDGAFRNEPKPMGEAREELYRVRIAAAIAQYPKLHRLWVHNDLTAMAATNDNGKYVVTAGASQDEKSFQLRFWKVDKDDDEQPHEVPCKNAVNAVKFSSDDKYLLAATGKKETAKGELIVCSWPEDRHQPPSLLKSSLSASGAVLDADFLPASDATEKPGVIAIVRKPDGTTDLNLWRTIDDNGPMRLSTTDSNDSKTSNGDIPAPVTALKVSPKGQFVAAWGAKENGQRNTLYIGKIEGLIKGQNLKDILTSGPAVKSLAFSASNEWMATVDDQGWATLWDTEGNKLLEWEAHAAAATHVAFGPDDRQLISAGIDHTAKLWEILVTQRQLGKSTGAERGQIEPSGQANSTEPSLSVQLKFTFSHESDVVCANFSPDGRYIATASRDRTVRVWDAATLRLATPPLYHAFAVRSVEFSADGFRLMARTDYTAQVWGLAAENPPPATLATSDWYTRVSFSSNGKYIIMMSRNPEVRGEVVMRVRDVRDAGTDVDILHKQFQLWGFADYNAWVSDDGDRALTMTTADGVKQDVQVWEKDSEESFQLDTRDLGIIRNAAFSSNGMLLLTASQPASRSSTPEWKLQVWNKNRDKGWSPLEESATQVGPVNHVAWNKEGDRLVISSGRVKDEKEGQARMWKLEVPDKSHPDKKRLEEGFTLKRESLNPQIQGSSNAVLFSAFSHNGKLVATGGADDVAYLWDAETGKRVPPPLLHASDIIHLTFDRDDKQLATSSTADGKCCVWNVDEVQSTILENVDAKFTLEHRGRVNRATFSTDGKLLATASADGMARVWHLASDGELAAVLVHDGNVQSACFSDDENSLITVSYNGLQASNRRREGDSEHDRPQVSLASFSDRCPQRWSWRLKPGSNGRGSFANSAELRGHARLLSASQLDDKAMFVVSLASPKESERATELQNLWNKHGAHLYAGSARPLDHLQLADVNQAIGQWWAVAWHVDRERRKLENEFAKRGSEKTLAENHILQEFTARHIKAKVLHWTIRAKDHRRSGQWKPAIDDWTKAIDLEPKRSSLIESRARAYGEIRQWPEAIKDWTKIIMETDDSAKSSKLSLFESRADAYGQNKQWKEAQDDFSEVFVADATASRGYDLARVQLKAENLKGYRQTCNELIGKISSDSEIDSDEEMNDRNTIVWVCVLAPNAVQEYNQLIGIANGVVEKAREEQDPNERIYLNTLGATYYRLGKYKEAKEALEKAIQVDVQLQKTQQFPRPEKKKDGTIWDWIFLAMTCQKQGDTKSAREWLRQAQDPFEFQRESSKSWITRAELELLRKEATELIEPERSRESKD
jgi:WD40 repeat protein/tetratricopeptide (TPR) repeat protein